jgi:uncharacterized protein (DUF924 family)
MNPPEEVLRFWLGDDPKNPLRNSALWWKNDPAFDREIREKFEEDLKRGVKGEYEAWKGTPHGCLAYVILFDQFSRNIYRETPQAFAQDALGLAACLEGIKRGFDRQLLPLGRSFFYMPLQHSEDPQIQRRSVEVFRRLAEEAPEDLKKALGENFQYALRHAEIVVRFGRFPHRNRILGRSSTQEEIEFLKTPGSSF